MADSAGSKADLGTRAAAATAAVLVGVGIGGPLGAIAAAPLSVLLEPLAEQVWGELRGDAKQRQGVMMAAAQEALGVDSAELERQILATEEARLQAGIALVSATRTTWEPKVRALGRALAAGLMATDDTKIDSRPLIMAALADIEFPHASLLELFVCYWPKVTPTGLVAESFDAPHDMPWAIGQRMWLSGDVLSARPRLKPVLPSLLGTLQRHGLAVQSDVQGDPMGRTARAMNQRFISDLTARGGVNLGAAEARYQIAGSWMPTELGEEVITVLLEAGAEFGADAGANA